MLPDLAKFLIFLGLVLAGVGILLLLAGHIPWLGRLPGDILIKRERFTFYFPLATSILISLLLTLIFWLLRR
jgi:hypothetical protein